MGTVRATLGSTLILGAVTAGALAVAGLGGAPAAHASCASFFGIGNSADCSSSRTSIAIAIGANATANALGSFSAAVAVGPSAKADTDDTVSVATAFGDHARASAHGLFSVAAQIGGNGLALTQAAGGDRGFGFNMAINVTPGATVPDSSQVEAGGLGNVAINLFGYGTSTTAQQVTADVVLGLAVNIGGTNNEVDAEGPSAAFNVLGSNNTVETNDYGVAVSLLQSNATVKQLTPGINVNGHSIPASAAGSPPNKRPSVTKTSTSTGKKTGSNGVGGSKRH